MIIVWNPHCGYYGLHINVITMCDEIDATSLKLTSRGQLLYKLRIELNKTEPGDQNKEHKKLWILTNTTE